jgi:hypothetical protein
MQIKIHKIMVFQDNEWQTVPEPGLLLAANAIKAAAERWARNKEGRTPERYFTDHGRISPRRGAPKAVRRELGLMLIDGEISQEAVTRLLQLASDHPEYIGSVKEAQTWINRNK